MKSVSSSRTLQLGHEWSAQEPEKDDWEKGDDIPDW